jgi:hypothetical protein
MTTRGRVVSGQPTQMTVLGAIDGLVVCGDRLREDGAALTRSPAEGWSFSGISSRE